MSAALLDELRAGIAAGAVIPYLGCGVVASGGEASVVPGSPEALVGALAAKHPVPGRLRRNLGAAAQYIENFRHRKALKAAMHDLFAPAPPVTPLHRWLAGLGLPLVVELWYHDAMGEALRARQDWGRVQGASRAEHREGWFRWFAPDGQEVTGEDAARWRTLLYQPWGSVCPDAGFL
ncbi:MAG TPA: SIR2 family protein, partial [Burkholderiales bacterium]|nr:SIR2 family protein [Burkholderiales bacterium]